MNDFIDKLLETIVYILIIISATIAIAAILGHFSSTKAEAYKGFITTDIGEITLIEYYSYEIDRFSTKCLVENGVRRLIVRWQADEDGNYRRDSISTLVCDCYIPATEETYGICMRIVPLYPTQKEE